MATILLVIHLLIALALIATVLLQRSEGGALGIGGGGGGMMSGRGQGNILTKTTAILAACFFMTSIGLTVIARNNTTSESKIDAIKVDGQKKSGKVLDGLVPAAEPKKQDGPVVPTPEAPKK
jgi:preprotein translocase subunit SecG